MSLEEALAQTERDALATQKAAEAVLKSAKRVVAAAKVGDVSAIEKAISDSEQAESAMRMQLKNTRDGWSFDAKAHAASGGLTAEIQLTAESQGMKVYEQDGRLFCYPCSFV